MLHPEDIPRIKSLVERHGDANDEKALARIVLTLFAQPTPETETENHDPIDDLLPIPSS